MKKNVLICLERLDIGGVETFVVNQATVLLSKGHTVVILAQKGLYTEKLEQKGAICIDFTFTLESKFDIEKMKQIQEIIRKYEINEVHINQFPCILSAMPASIFCNIPYIAYSHAGIDDVFDWFMDTFDIYAYIFEVYFQNAYKVITIKQEAKNRLIERFGIQDEKIEIIYNSIDYEEIDQIRKEEENQKRRFLLISRLSEDKKDSLYNAINLFKTYKNKVENANLIIIGSGTMQSELEEYVKNLQIKDIEFKGPTSNVLAYINHADIVLGLGRCILEAIAMKKIAIILGHKELKGIVTPENIQMACQGNFAGDNLPTYDMETVTQDLINLDNIEIQQIQEGNDSFARANLNARINYHNVIQEDIHMQIPSDIVKLLSYIIKKQEEMDKKQEEFAKEQEVLKNDIRLLNENNREIQEKNQKQINEQKERIQVLEKEREEIYASKRWRYTEKLSKFLHKKN